MAVAGGTRVTDDIDFEPPRGLFGLMANARFIERELGMVFRFRAQKLKELLGGEVVEPAGESAG
jgi:hypothetical protein